MQTVAAASSAGSTRTRPRRLLVLRVREEARQQARQGRGWVVLSKTSDGEPACAQTHLHQAWFGSCQQQSKWHGGVVEAV